MQENTIAPEGESLRAEAEVLRQHPRFAAARPVYLGELVRWREGGKLMHKLSAHKARMHVVGYLLHLSARSVVEGGDGGVGYGALYEIAVARRGEVSARVLKTMLALMSLAGFIETRRGDDRRQKFYRPTARMLDHARLAYGYAAAALDVIEPEAERARRLRHDPPFLQRMLVSAGAAHAAAPPGALMPEFIDFIGNREGAGPVLAALLLEGEAPSRAALATRFGLSKSQVAQVILGGVERGLLTLDARGGPVATALLRETFSQWIAVELAFHRRHMR